MDKNWGKNTFPWDAICVCETGYSSSAHGKKSIIMDIVRFILCKKKGKKCTFWERRENRFFFFLIAKKRIKLTRVAIQQQPLFARLYTIFFFVTFIIFDSCSDEARAFFLRTFMYGG